MVYAATVTLHDAEGEAIHTIRYGRMPKGDVRGLCRGLARDATAMRAQRSDLKVAYLTDGATEFETLHDQHSLILDPMRRRTHILPLRYAAPTAAVGPDAAMDPPSPPSKSAERFASVPRTR